MPRRRIRRPSPEARREAAEIVRQLQAEPYQVLVRQLVEARGKEEREVARRAIREWCVANPVSALSPFGRSSSTMRK